MLEGRPGPLVDGSAYADDAFIAELEDYHRAAVGAHRNHAKLTMAMPSRPGALVLDLTATVPDDTEVWRRPEPLNAPTGNGASPPTGPAQP